jgi:hypothetical protein
LILVDTGVDQSVDLADRLSIALAKGKPDNFTYTNHSASGAARSRRFQV